MRAERIIILAFETPYADLVIRDVAVSLGRAIVGIVRSRSVYGDPHRLRGAIRLATRCAPQFLAWRAWEALEHASVRSAPALPHLREIAARLRVPLLDTADANSATVLTWMRSLAPDVLLCVYLDQRLTSALAVPRVGAVNLHPSLLPRDRGLFPVFWQILRGDACTGATAHLMNDRLDAGPILTQRRIPIDRQDTVQTLSVKGAMACAAITENALDALATGSRVAAAPDVTPNYNGPPRRGDWALFRARRRRYGKIGFIRALAWGLGA